MQKGEKQYHTHNVLQPTRRMLPDDRQNGVGLDDDDLM
jgi:hypothetical protein